MAHRPGDLLTYPRVWLNVGYGVVAALGIGILVFSYLYRSPPLPVSLVAESVTAFASWSFVAAVSGFYISVVVRIVGALFVAVAMLPDLHGIDIGPGWLWQLLGAVVFYGLLFSTRHLRQVVRDEGAAALAEQLRSGVARDDLRSFCLYLRPFEMTDGLPTRVSDAGVGEKGERVDFESLLSDSLAPQYRLVALGRPGEMYGAGRVRTSEEDWRADFRLLAAAADFVLLLPSANPGTFEEIGWLADNDLVDRCVWLMPAAVEPALLADTRQRERQESSWERARSACASLGILLPPYDVRGLLIRIGPDGTVAAMEPSSSGFWAVAGLRRCLYRLWRPAG